VSLRNRQGSGRQWFMGYLFRDRQQKQREEALLDLRENRASVMVATDVMARGIDIKELDHVSCRLAMCGFL
jgi:superfamily II DNA/RNA helicase